MPISFDGFLSHQSINDYNVLKAIKNETFIRYNYKIKI